MLLLKKSSVGGCRSPATNRSLVLHASWPFVIGHRRSRGPTTNAQKYNNISLNVSGIGLYGVLMCVSGYGWSLHQHVRIITGSFILVLLYNTTELFLDSMIIYHLSTSILWGTGKNGSYVVRENY